MAAPRRHRALVLDQAVDMYGRLLDRNRKLVEDRLDDMLKAQRTPSTGSVSATAGSAQCCSIPTSATTSCGPDCCQPCRSSSRLSRRPRGVCQGPRPLAGPSGRALGPPSAPVLALKGRLPTRSSQRTVGSARRPHSRQQVARTTAKVCRPERARLSSTPRPQRRSDSVWWTHGLPPRSWTDGRERDPGRDQGRDGIRACARAVSSELPWC